ncbi:hypothetical protein BGW80DRAFT_442368 [Lactifluus volemus]|nr:hypothetical protein BGW80DRAFT_442368 [Lactifluus volemus]
MPFSSFRSAPPADRVYRSLPLTTVEIVLLYDDFVLGRSIVPPHAACVRPTLVRWDPRAPLSLENSAVGDMMEVSRAMSRIFAMPDEAAVHEEILGLNRARLRRCAWRADRFCSVRQRDCYLELRGVGRRGCSCRAGIN